MAFDNCSAIPHLVLSVWNKCGGGGGGGEHCNSRT